MNIDQAILAFAIKDKKFMMELSNSITPDFITQKFRWFYAAIEEHFVDPNFKEIPSLNILREKVEDEYVPKAEKLYSALEATELDESEFTWYLHKIKERYNEKLHQDCVENIGKIKASGEEDGIDKANRALRETLARIDSIYKQEAYREGSLSESTEERLKAYYHIKENPDAFQGVPTGFIEIDKRTNGLHPGELMIIAGGTGSGKSILMSNMAINGYLNGNNPLEPFSEFKEGFNVLYFSLEMPKASCERRIDACMGNLDYGNIKSGLLSEEDEEKYKQVLLFQEKYPYNFHIVDMAKGVTPREVELKYNEIMETRFKPDLVVIDYIGIMSPNTPGESDWLAMGKVSAELHEFARVYDVPVITGSQVNRPPKDGRADYSTNRIARSDTITHNANIILQIASREDERLRTDMEIHIVKIRDAEPGSFILSKNFSRMKVWDLSEENFDDEDEDEFSV